MVSLSLSFIHSFIHSLCLPIGRQWGEADRPHGGDAGLSVGGLRHSASQRRAGWPSHRSEGHRPEGVHRLDPGRSRLCGQRYQVRGWRWIDNQQLLALRQSVFYMILPQSDWTVTFYFCWIVQRYASLIKSKVDDKAGYVLGVASDRSITTECLSVAQCAFK